MDCLHGDLCVLLVSNLSEHLLSSSQSVSEGNARFDCAHQLDAHKLYDVSRPGSNDLWGLCRYGWEVSPIFLDLKLLKARFVGSNLLAHVLETSALGISREYMLPE